MLLIVPYNTTVKRNVIPWVNYGFIAAQAAVFFLSNIIWSPRQIDKFILDEWSARAIFGYMWLHADFPHLLLNLLYLWVFGNALCAGIGNLRYFFLYIAAGVLAACGYMIFDGRPVIGASGANCGVVVALCLLFPFERIRTCILLFVFPVYTFVLMGMWFIIIKFFYELLFSFIGMGRIAYVCHLSGIVGTGILVYLLMKLKILNPHHSDRDLLRAINSSL